jgi:acyl-CoA reductase-like NAD-dependent aldehyde dehydrogenase
MIASLTTHDPVSYVSHNPATGQLVRTYDLHGSQELDQRLQVAWDAWDRLRKLPTLARAELLDRLAAHFEAGTDKYAALITREMGKTIGEARKEIEKCAATCRKFAEDGPAWLRPDSLATEASASYISYESMGPVLAIMPWNFPFFQVMRFVAAAIMAGNTTVLKHAENVPGCAEALESAVTEACSRDGLLVNIRVPRPAVPSVVSDPRIRAVTFTGSAAAGHAVAGLAGKAGKKVALELGGSDPFIVLDDANLDRVIPAAVEARFANAGQSCICSKRFVVARPLAEDFLHGFAKAASQLVVGDPEHPSTSLGPLARADLRSGLHRQVEASLAMGATPVLAGGPGAGPGHYYLPVILADIPPGSPAATEELFGPVASVFTTGDDDEAIKIANETRFGLGCSVWTEDNLRAAPYIESIAAGMVFVNGTVRSDARIPFGGVKDSGFGRELGSAGVREFTNAKTVWIA